MPNPGDYEATVGSVQSRELERTRLPGAVRALAKAYNAQRVWKARAEGLIVSLEEAWRRGAGFTGLRPYDGTMPHAEQIAAFNRRFRPWLTDPKD